MGFSGGTMKLILFSILTLFTATSAFGDAKDFYFQRYIERHFKNTNPGSEPPSLYNFTSLFESPMSRKNATSVEEGTIDQLINHGDSSDLRTFKQKYFFNSTYATKPNAPVLLYICGESECSGISSTVN